MNEYNNLIEEFDNLNIMDKRDEIIAEIKELFSVFHIMLLERGIADTPLIHPDMNDDGNGTEDDFLNSTYAYLISLKENIGKYFYE